MTDLLTHLPDDSRSWIYTADRPLVEEDVAAVSGVLDRFFAEWTSHGRVVQGGGVVLDGRFVVIAASIPGGDLSGCGIDKSVHALDSIGSERGITWLDALPVVYRDHDGAVNAISRPAFRRLVGEGIVTAATPVFDTAQTNLGVLRTQGLERPAGDSWHARLFRIPTMV